MLLKYSFLGVLILCVALVESQNRNVYNFKIASWNTNGARWQSILALMRAENIDVLGVQEAGRLPPMTLITSAPSNNAPSYYLIGQLNGQYQEDSFPIVCNLGFSEFKLDNQYYLYYYDRSSSVNGQPTTKKQNIAIVSKTRASKVLLFPPETRQNSQTKNQAECDDRLFVNRPTLGIQIENSVFFNLHTEPRPNNEADLIVNQINKFMNQKHRQMTWILMGDFNRHPDTLRQLIVNLPPSMDLKFISPNQGTHGNNIIDFGIVGGPATVRTSMESIRVKLLSQFNGGGNTGETRSDHEPIEFY